MYRFQMSSEEEALRREISGLEQKLSQLRAEEKRLRAELGSQSVDPHSSAHMRSCFDGIAEVLRSLQLDNND
jgi:phage shock protein A